MENLELELNEKNIELYEKFNNIDTSTKDAIIEKWAGGQWYGYVKKYKENGKTILVYGEGKAPVNLKVWFFVHHDCMQRTIRFSAKEVVLKHYDLNEEQLSLIKNENLYFNLEDHVMIKEVGQRIKDYHELAY
jgi:hypothetical protein